MLRRSLRLLEPVDETVAVVFFAFTLLAVLAARAIHLESTRRDTEPQLKRYDGPRTGITSTSPTVREAHYVNPIGVRFVRVPAPPRPPGTEPCPADTPDAPCHFIFVSERRITQAQWFAITGFNPSQNVAADAPVNNISFIDAREFMRDTQLVDGGVYRLPSPAEWDWLVRAGANDPTDSGPRWCPIRCGTDEEPSGFPDVPSAHPWGVLELCDDLSEWTAVDEDPNSLHLALTTQTANVRGSTLIRREFGVCERDQKVRADFFDKSSRVGIRLILEPRP
jgi:hypothetical protein